MRRTAKGLDGACGNSRGNICIRGTYSCSRKIHRVWTECALTLLPGQYTKSRSQIGGSRKIKGRTVSRHTEEIRDGLSRQYRTISTLTEFIASTPPSVAPRSPTAQQDCQIGLIRVDFFKVKVTEVQEGKRVRNHDASAARGKQRAARQGVLQTMDGTFTSWSAGGHKNYYL